MPFLCKILCKPVTPLLHRNGLNLPRSGKVSARELLLLAQRDEATEHVRADPARLDVEDDRHGPARLARRTRSRARRAGRRDAQLVVRAASQVVRVEDLLLAPHDADHSRRGRRIEATEPDRGVVERAGAVVTFPSSPTVQDKAAAAERLNACWSEMLRALPRRPDTDWTQFERYSAREMTEGERRTYRRYA